MLKTSFHKKVKEKMENCREIIEDKNNIQHKIIETTNFNLTLIKFCLQSETYSIRVHLKRVIER